MSVCYGTRCGVCSGTLWAASVAASQPGAEDNRVRSTRRAKHRVAAYVKQCRVLVERAKRPSGNGGYGGAMCGDSRVYRPCSEQDETIARGEGGAGSRRVRPAGQWNLGFRSVSLRTSTSSSCITRSCGRAVNVAVPMIQETQALHPDFRVCSFDRGFHSPENRLQLDDMLDLNALPRKGRHSRADRGARGRRSVRRRPAATSGSGVGDQ